MTPPYTWDCACRSSRIRAPGWGALRAPPGTHWGWTAAPSQSQEGLCPPDTSSRGPLCVPTPHQGPPTLAGTGHSLRRWDSLTLQSLECLNFPTAAFLPGHGSPAHPALQPGGELPSKQGEILPRSAGAVGRAGMVGSSGNVQLSSLPRCVSPAPATAASPAPGSGLLWSHLPFQGSGLICLLRDLIYLLPHRNQIWSDPHRGPIQSASSGI